MNELREIAQSNADKVNNIRGNFTNTKLSRIESFLGKVDDLFTVIAYGRDNYTNKEIRDLIDAFAINPHMYALQAQGNTINTILRPQQRRSSNRQILLSKPNYNNNDKRILSFSIGVSLIGIVEKINDELVGIRDVRNINSGTRISTKGKKEYLLKIEDKRPPFQRYVTRGRLPLYHLRKAIYIPLC